MKQRHIRISGLVSFQCLCGVEGCEPDENKIWCVRWLRLLCSSAGVTVTCHLLPCDVPSSTGFPRVGRGPLVPALRRLHQCWELPSLPVPLGLHWELLWGAAEGVLVQSLPARGHLQWLHRRIQVWGESETCRDGAAVVNISIAAEVFCLQTYRLFLLPVTITVLTNHCFFQSPCAQREQLS